ncbi:MAG: metal-dependent hydrolase [Deltaproteobacteria bacterium]|nr:metal-dependent hydrolase [Deltaproteobacteria bacterium]
MPRIRKMGLSFDQVPRRWFFDSTFVTHSANALNMLFPAGERMFVRSVKHYLPQITSPTLKARVRAFFGQEGSHGHEHERAFQILEAQGYEIRPWLERYERLAFQWLEPSFPPVLRLSTTVALEHFTAAMAEVALTEDFLDHAHPTMQQLLRWHAAEEIEHKSVAFDVLQQVDPRYAVRMVGMVLGLVGLLAFWHSGTQMLLRQEKDYSRAKRRQERKAARARGQDRKAIAKALVEYLRPGFHPDDRDTSPLARAYLEQIGRLEG